MIKITLPFWLAGLDLAKLRGLLEQWWDLASTWIKWPLSQLDPLTCTVGILDLLAYQRDIQRFDNEPLDLYRLRVALAYVNARDAGSKAGFIAIFQRLGIGYVEIEERVDAIDWDVILLYLSDNQISANTQLLQDIIYKYGRTCRRYELTTLTPITCTTPVWAVGHVYDYHVAGI